MFKLLGVILACYTVHGLATGAIYARSGAWGRTFHRDQEPSKYWSAIAAYLLLTCMLILVF